MFPSSNIERGASASEAWSSPAITGFMAITIGRCVLFIFIIYFYYLFLLFILTSHSAVRLAGKPEHGKSDPLATGQGNVSSENIGDIIVKIGM